MKQRKNKPLKSAPESTRPTISSRQGENTAPQLYRLIAVVLAAACVYVAFNALPQKTALKNTTLSTPQNKLRKSLQGAGKRIPGVNGYVKRVRVNTANRLGPLKNYPLYVVDDFLPIDLAETWRDAMLSEWNTGSGT